MATKKNEILGLNQYMKSDKMLYIIYTDIYRKLEKYMDMQIIWKNLK